VWPWQQRKSWRQRKNKAASAENNTYMKGMAAAYGIIGGGVISAAA